MARVFRPKNTSTRTKKNEYIYFGLWEYGLLVLMVIVSFLWIWILRSHSSYIWIIDGVIIASYLILKKDFLFNSQKSSNYYWGEIGETNTEKELTALPNSYTVFLDVLLPHVGGNIDCVVIGPTGIFVIEVKADKPQQPTIWGPKLPWYLYIKHCNQTYWETMQFKEFCLNKRESNHFINSILVLAHPQFKQWSNTTQNKNVCIVPLHLLNQTIMNKYQINIEQSRIIDALILELENNHKEI